MQCLPGLRTRVKPDPSGMIMLYRDTWDREEVEFPEEVSGELPELHKGQGQPGTQHCYFKMYSKPLCLPLIPTLR